MWEANLSDFGPRGDLGQIRQRPYRRGGGNDREQRLQITMAVGAAILLLLGVGIGFSLGRFTAPKATAPAPVITQTETTLPAEPTVDTSTADASASLDASITDQTSASVEPTSDTKSPPRPRQLAPANGESVNTSRVNLRWSKVKDDSGLAVTYSFEIQDRRSGGTYGNAQTIDKLKANSYSVRVLSVRRRWRVWAIDAAGNASSKSVWRSFVRTIVIPKKSTDSSSTGTTTTEH